MKWNEMKWNEMKWNEMKWNKIKVVRRKLFKLIEHLLSHLNLLIVHVLQNRLGQHFSPIIKMISRYG